MEMAKKEIEFLKDVISAKFEEEGNKYITETAGFVPLEVKFKRFEQAGQIMQFSQSEFTSSDLRQIYLNPDFEITPEDDLEEIQEKVAARNEFIMQLKEQKKAGSSEGTASSPNVSAAAQTENKTEQKEDVSDKE